MFCTKCHRAIKAADRERLGFEVIDGRLYCAVDAEGIKAASKTLKTMRANARKVTQEKVTAASERWQRLQDNINNYERRQSTESPQEGVIAETPDQSLSDQSMRQSTLFESWGTENQ